MFAHTTTLIPQFSHFISKIGGLDYFGRPYLSQELLVLSQLLIPNRHPTSNRRRFHVDITSIHRRPNFDEFPCHFHILFRCKFADQKSTSFPRTFFDVISVVKKSTFFPVTFFTVISLVEKSTLLPRTFFDVISLVEISTMFLLISFDLILMAEFARTYFEEVLMGKNLTSLMLSLKLMKTFGKVFLC